ncbi:iron ABC transporter permease [Segatella baroniae]|nr:iron ABC transporter permease [Segatella baroniae]
MGAVIGLLFMLNLLVGSVRIPVEEVVRVLTGHSGGNPSWRFIILESRLPQALTALLGGGAMAVSGLMLQTAFRNPLAGPDVFGINSGAGLGVALVMLAMGGSLTAGGVTFTGFMAVLLAAFAGAMLVTAVIFGLSSVMRSNVMLLIVGLMIGYLANSAISLLNFFATEEGVRSYMVWGMGNFSSVSMAQMPLFASVTVVGLAAAVLLVKPLNALLLGTQYAENLGFDVRRLRNRLLVVTGLLTAVVTAFCGPIAFIGLAVPHMARLLLRTDNHQLLLPGTILCGMAVALVCNVLCALPGRAGVIPLNAVTPLIGAPVIIYVVVKRR